MNRRKSRLRRRAAPIGIGDRFRRNAHSGAATVVQLLGKGRKERAVPLWTRTGRCLRQWFDEEGEATPDYAFRNARGDRLTR